MSDTTFKPWEKIPRDNPFNVTITDKMDGTNSCIVIEDSVIVAVQSRKRFITPECDNFGFAQWVKDNNDDLLGLGDGYHYGEWVGPGIQKNPHCLDKKTLYLFNTWLSDTKPDCCEVVEVLFNGIMSPGLVEDMLDCMRRVRDNTELKPEGVVVYYHTFRSRTKHTVKSPNGKWCK